MAKTKRLRSLIQEKLPFELRVELELLSRRRDLTNPEKQDELIKLLRKYDIPNFVSLGPGTNRFAFKLDGFVVKVATDGEGKIDNQKEFKMSKILWPGTSMTYEVSKNGTLLVAEYCQPFSGFSDMQQYEPQIREILKGFTKRGFLIGDIGITAKNYANWGIRIRTKKPVCIDYAYTYDVSSNLLLCCNCEAGQILVPTENYVELICPACGQHTKFQELRRRISMADHLREIGDLTDNGYLLSAPSEEVELDPRRSSYLRGKSEYSETQDVEEEQPLVVFESQIKGDEDMSWKEKVIGAKLSGTSTLTPIKARTISSGAKTRLVHDDGTPVKAALARVIKPEPPKATVPTVPQEPEVVTPKFTFQDDDPEPVANPVVNEEDEDVTDEFTDIVEKAKAAAENNEEHPEDEMDETGTVQISVCESDLSGVYEVELKIGTAVFPLYVSDEDVDHYRDLSGPVSWDFLKHFEPVNYFKTKTPTRFLGVYTNDQIPIIPVLILEDKDESLFGIFVDEEHLVDDGDGYEPMNEYDAMAFIRVINQKMHELMDKTDLFSRWAINVTAEEGFISEAEAIRMFEENGIHLSQPPRKPAPPAPKEDPAPEPEQDDSDMDAAEAAALDVLNAEEVSTEIIPTTPRKSPVILPVGKTVPAPKSSNSVIHPVTK